jgi:hypothetical protein
MTKTLISTISKNYAKALMEIATEQKSSEKIEKQLNQIFETIESSEDLRIVISNSSISTSTKIEIIDEVNDKTTVWKYSEDNVKIKQGIAGDYVLDFGRHVGKTIEQVYNEDPKYIDWILTKSDFNNNEVKLNITLYKIMIGYNITKDKLSELMNTCPAK